jgi:hypothetical protein
MIKQVTQGGSVGVKLNDVEGGFFLTGKVLRQEDPLAPLSFNFVVGIFSRMINKGSSCGIIRGLCPHLVPSGVVSLQYADDTLIFLEKDERNAVNLEWTLTCVEQISGMKINYHKSELMAINIEQGEMQPYLDILQCVAGALIRLERIYNF